jgi:hypothetical protein
VGKNWKRLHPDCDSVSDSVIDSFWIILGSVRRMKQNMLWPCWRLCQAHLHALRSCEVSPSQQLPQSVNGYPIWTMDISPEILRGFEIPNFWKSRKVKMDIPCCACCAVSMLRHADPAFCCLLQRCQHGSALGDGPSAVASCQDQRDQGRKPETVPKLVPKLVDDGLKG